MNILQMPKPFLDQTGLEKAYQQSWVIRPWEPIRCSPSRCWKLGATGKHVGHSEPHIGIQLFFHRTILKQNWSLTVLQCRIG